MADCAVQGDRLEQCVQDSACRSCRRAELPTPSLVMRRPGIAATLLDRGRAAGQRATPITLTTAVRGDLTLSYWTRDTNSSPVRNEGTPGQVPAPRDTRNRL